MGFEGFSGLESILYHLQSPCRVIECGEFEPIVREEWVPEAHAHRHLKTWDVAARRRRGQRTAAPDVEQRRRDLGRSPDRRDGLLLPERRGGRGRSSCTKAAGTLETIFGDLPYEPGDYVVVPRGTTYRFRPEGEQRYLVFETPGLITIPKRYRNEHGQLMEHAPYYHRDIHAPDAAAHAPRPRRVRGQGARARRLPDLRDRLPPVRRRRLGRLRLSVDVLDPRLRADHRAHPHAAAVAPDVRRPELRHLLVLPAQARLRPGRDPDPVPPLESPERGDDLLRRRQLLVAQGDRGRLGDAASDRPAARAAAGPRREVARDDRDARVRRDVRHVQPAAADDARRRHSTTASTCSRGRRTRRRTAARPTTTPPASPLTYSCSSSSTGTAPARCRTRSWPRSTSSATRRSTQREYASYGEALAAEVGTLRRTADEAARWAVENVELRAGFHELVERYRPLDRLERPAAADHAGARTGRRRARGALELRRPGAGRLARALPPRGAVPGLRRPLQAPLAAGRAAARLRRRRLVGSLRRRSPPTASSRAPGSPTTSTSRASRTSGTRRSTMSLLRFPDPYDFELSTGRFRAFGTDLANRLDGEVLVRAVARPRGAHPGAPGRRRRRAARRRDSAGRRAPARRAVRSRRVLRVGGGRSACSHRSCERLRGFRPPLQPDPFEALITSITAQQVSLFSAVAIRNRLIERFGVPGRRRVGVPDARAHRRRARGRALRGRLHPPQGRVRRRPRPERPRPRRARRGSTTTRCGSASPRCAGSGPGRPSGSSRGTSPARARGPPATWCCARRPATSTVSR